MYAQLIESTTTPEQIAELGLAIRRELITALRREPGFSGAISLLDHARCRSLLVVLWETDEEALSGCNAPIAAAWAAVASLATAGPSATTVWEVRARG